MWIHGLFAIYAFATAWGLVWPLLHVLLLILNLLWREWITRSSFFIPHFTLWACLGIGPPFFSLAPIFLYFWFMGQLVFLPRHSIAFAMLLLDLCLLGLFGPTMHFSFIQFTLLIVFCWVNPYTILGFLGPFYSIGHPWPIPFLHSHELFLCLFGFPRLTTIFFTFGACWPLYQPHLLILFFGLLRPLFACFLLLIIPMSLLLPFLGSLGPVCFLWAFLLFYRPVDHYSCHSGLMVFFSLC